MSSLGRGMACVALAALAGAGCAGPSEGPGGGDIYRPPEARDDGARDDTARPHDAAEDEPGTGHHCAEASYIWISNTGEGTLAKVCTLDGIEVGRYQTREGGMGDPSRTSVNLHGEMVVTNRSPSSGPSSVTKFAAEPEYCVDRNGDTAIRTSRGPDDVLDWGEDECMIWNTILPDSGATSAIGARATAWDGTEDPDTGAGGFVWIGALDTNDVFKLDGATGEIVARTRVDNSPYGGAIDGRGNFWIVSGWCVTGTHPCRLARVNTTSLAVDYFTVTCGYGISVDSRGRIWTSGHTWTETTQGSCVNRLDPTTGEQVTYQVDGVGVFYRGIAVDNVGSVWVAETAGNVIQIREDDVTPVNVVSGIAPAQVIGVAIDYQHNVWAVSQGGDMVVKINPATYEFEQFPIGRSPYTYSDMTGYQLRTVIIF
jgi:hypothetical protein